MEKEGGSLTWVLGGGALVVALAAAVILLRRRKVFVPPPTPPHEIAYEALRRLVALQLIEKEEIELFFVHLSKILRDYVENRFEVMAPERTTEEFLVEAASHPALGGHQARLGRFLTLCDQVKFARFQPDDATIQEAFDVVKQFLAETNPMTFELFEFHHPWMFLLALPALAVLYVRGRGAKGNAAIVFPSVARLKGLRPTLRQRARMLVPLLQAVAICGFVVAAARPRQGDARTVVRSQGIAIQMVLDRSGSMEETMLYDGDRRKRMDIVKDVFMKFVAGGDGLAGRKTDLIGLTSFARFTEESCPLVSEHEPSSPRKESQHGCAGAR